MRGTNYYINRQVSVVSYFLVLILLFSSSLWPIILSKPKEAAAVAANLHMFWTGGSAPSGWTIVSDGSEEDFYRRFIKGAATYSGTGGSESSQTHTVSTDVAATGSAGRDTTTGTNHSVIGHAHYSDTNVSSALVMPPYKQIMVIEYTTGGVPSTLPAGVVGIFDATPPAGWTTLTSHNSQFLRAYNDATTTGGTATHTHNVTTTSSYTIQARTQGNGFGSSVSAFDHTHTLASSPYVTSSASNLPAYINVILASKDSDGAAPAGVVGFFDADAPYGWTVLSNGGAFDGVYLQGSSSYGGTGGSNTHSHDDSGGQTSTNASASGFAAERGTEAAAFGTHAHSITFSSFETKNNEPPYIEVIFAKKADVYQPNSNNWRWYGDEETDTSSSALTTVYAAENTAPPQAEMGKSIGFKLRVNFTEVAGVAGNNSRKNLQYSTSTDGPWTAIGSTAATDKLFRYYNGGGNDNATINTVVLTGSSSTYKGILNESSSANPSGADQPASTTVEFEYSFENYNAVANTLYYFSFNDETAGDIPLVSGKSYPSLTTASTYSLSTTTPTAVYLGTWAIGSSTYATYDFVGGEEITVRDNRGQTSGSSSGWSTTAEMTTPLKYVETPSSISNPVFTGLGANDMTINGSAYFTGSVTTYYKVQIDGTMSDTFKWSDDGGSTWDGTKVACGSGAVLNNGIIIDFPGPVGHNLGDYWTFTATPEVVHTITAANTYFITNTITGLYAAPTTGITGNAGEYMSSAVTAATVSGSGKQGLGGFTFLPTLRMYGANTVGEYEGVLTFTLT